MNNLLFLLKRNDLAGVFSRLVVLSMVLTLVFLVSATLTSTADQFGICVSAFAVILVSSMFGQIAGEFPRGDEFVLFRLVGSIGARSGLVLLFLVFTRQWHLSNQGFIYYILAFYSVGLLADVMLTSYRMWQTPMMQPTEKIADI